jgi:hypothetical protein
MIILIDRLRIDCVDCVRLVRHRCDQIGLRMICSDRHRSTRMGREKGQALIYGLFVLVAGLVALFFLFNTGQLIAEKTKLVNTADAVAYSAGVMHARALNFDAYTNRALMANEVMIAQAVSIASWTRHVALHTHNVPPLLCYNIYTAIPPRLGLLYYTAACFGLSIGPVGAAADEVDRTVQDIAREAVRSSEAAKVLLQGAQQAMAASFLPARARLMQQVADANYAGDGSVNVAALPLTDGYVFFDGEPFIKSYGGAGRGRFKEAALSAAYKDSFVEQRSWSERSPWPCLISSGADFKRRGGTGMVGLDEWKAVDTAALHRWHPDWSWSGFDCDDEPELPLGYGSQIASKARQEQDGGNYGGVRDNPVTHSRAASVASADWRYSGLPTFDELSGPALAQADPRLKFAVALTRDQAQTKTSAGTSAIRPSGRIAIYQGPMAAGRLSAVSTSEVFFRRPTARIDGQFELGSLFNPYWQVHLIPNSAADVAAAILP